MRNSLLRPTRLRLISVALMTGISLVACAQEPKPALTPEKAPTKTPMKKPSASASTAKADAARGMWQKQWQQWQQKAPASYRMVFQRDCYCTPAGRGPFVVQVSAGKVQSVTRITSPMAADATPRDYFTSTARETVTSDQNSYSLSALMQDLGEQLQRQHDDAKIQYDTNFGYARSVMIDFERMMADEEYGYHVIAFEAQ